MYFQLSLVKIDAGMRVLLVGGKGGFINSLVAQVVGSTGNVVTVSSNNNILNICKKRVRNKSPVAHIMDWKWVPDVANPGSILELFKNETESGEQKFHAIIYCGAVKELPLDMALVLANEGSLIAPVDVDEKEQQLLMVIKRAGKIHEIRGISDFNVTFAKVQ